MMQLISAHIQKNSVVSVCINYCIQYTELNECIPLKLLESERSDILRSYFKLEKIKKIKNKIC